MSDKKTVTGLMMGGLGNQLFIYATARRFAQINGAHLVLDAYSGFANDKAYNRVFLLDRFKIKAAITRNGGWMKRVKLTFLKRLSYLLPFGWAPFYQEKSPFEYDPQLFSLQPQSDIYLNGYWQSPRYFEDIGAQIRRELDIVGPLSPQRLAESDLILAQENPVAVGLRRYQEVKKRGLHPVITIDYYLRAMDLLRFKYPNAYFVYFTDDNDWVAKNLPLDKSCYLATPAAGNEGAPEKLWLMSQCRHFIISNSTFDWWAAWLADIDAKTVIAPDKGFSNRDIYPPGWLQIPAEFM